MELSPEARAKSAFVTPLDKFEFTRCPFSLSQAPTYFQRLMNQVIKGLPFAFVYLDDVLIHSPDIETHLKHIRILFQRLRKADLKLKDSKCNYFKTRPILGTSCFRKGDKTLTGEIRKCQENASTHYPKGNKAISRISGILQEVYS